MMKQKVLEIKFFWLPNHGRQTFIFNFFKIISMDFTIP